MDHSECKRLDTFRFSRAHWEPTRKAKEWANEPERSHHFVPLKGHPFYLAYETFLWSAEKLAEIEENLRIPGARGFHGESRVVLSVTEAIEYGWEEAMRRKEERHGGR